MPIKIKCLGAEGYVNQIDRIREGMSFWSVSADNDYTHIYCNDPSTYDQALELKKQNKNIKLIFNVLDLPPHIINPDKYDLSRYPFVEHNWNRNFDPMDLCAKLYQADYITCICKEVQWQLKNFCGLDSEVVYNPIKDVEPLTLNYKDKLLNKNGRPYRYLIVGRADPNKRHKLIYKACIDANIPFDSIAVVGSEYSGIGDYYGVVNDEILNLFYNTVDYLFFPSAFKSIGLPALEATICGAIPIVTDDDPCSFEFFNGIAVPPNKIGEYIVSEEWNKKANNFVKINGPIFKEKFDKKTIAKNIIDLL